MITKSEFKILGEFRKNFFKTYTFNELKQNLKESSNNKIQLALKHFEEEELILITRKKGFNLIDLNLKSPLLVHYFGLIDFEKINHKAKDILFKIKESLSKKDIFFSLLIFGSHAKGNLSKNSDLDIAIILEEGADKKEIKPLIKSIKRKSLLEIDEHYFHKKEFLEMLKNSQENLGKEIFRSFLVFYGGEFFYNLIFENARFN